MKREEYKALYRKKKKAPCFILLFPGALTAMRWNAVERWVDTRFKFRKHLKERSNNVFMEYADKEKVKRAH